MDDQQKQQMEYINQIEEELKSTQEKESVLQSKLTELETQLSDLRSELAILQSALCQEQADIDKLEEKIALLEARIDNLLHVEPKFTESAPIYTKMENHVVYANFNGLDDSSVSFLGFKDYCKNTFPNHYLWLLSPIDEAPWVYREYSVLCEKIENNVPEDLLIRERLMMYSPILGCEQDYYEGESAFLYSIDMEIFIKPDIDLNPYSVDLKFGEINGGGYWKKYINFYVRGECVATCFYQHDVHVSEKWLAEYFKNYFVYVQ
jgi:hypothetical protein